VEELKVFYMSPGIVRIWCWWYLCYDDGNDHNQHHQSMAKSKWKLTC
jgi:hypothetical protein